MNRPCGEGGTQRTGGLYQARQTAQSQQRKPAELVLTPCEKQVISTDGAYVPLVKGEWAEVRTVAIGQIKEKVCRQGQRVVQTDQLSCFSRMTDAETFGD